MFPRLVYTWHAGNWRVCVDNHTPWPNTRVVGTRSQWPGKHLGTVPERLSHKLVLETRWKSSRSSQTYAVCQVQTAPVYAASCRSRTSQSRARSRASPFEICDGQSDTRTGFSFLRVLRFSVCVIPPLLHTYFIVLLLLEEPSSEASNLQTKQFSFRCRGSCM